MMEDQDVKALQQILNNRIGRLGLEDPADDDLCLSLSCLIARWLDANVPTEEHNEGGE